MAAVSFTIHDVVDQPIQGWSLISHAHNVLDFPFSSSFFVAAIADSDTLPPIGERVEKSNLQRFNWFF